MDIGVPFSVLGHRALSFAARPHGMLIGGRWINGQRRRTYPVYHPMTGQSLSRIAQAEIGDIDAAVACAGAALGSPDWAELSGTQRGALLSRLADILEVNADELAELESLTENKSSAETRAFDVPFAVELLRFIASWLARPPLQVTRPSAWRGLRFEEPRGTRACVMPGRMALMMAIWEMAPHLAAGSTFVVIPPEAAPLAALRFGEIVSEAGFPGGVINILAGTHAVQSYLATHPDLTPL